MSFRTELYSNAYDGFHVATLLQAKKIWGFVTRTEIYSKFVDHVLTEHPSNSHLYDEAGMTAKVERVLQKLAFDSLANPEPLIQLIPINGNWDNMEVPLHILLLCGLVNYVRESNNHALSFVHQSLQEYLAAKHAAISPGAADQLITERWQPKWVEVIRFFFGLKGEPLLETILAEPDNIIYSNLFFAAKLCLRDTESQFVEHEENQFGALPSRKNKSICKRRHVCTW